MPVDDLNGTICGFAIALADNDGEGRDIQLYPINGQNDSWQGKNLGSLAFGDQALRRQMQMSLFLSKQIQLTRPLLLMEIIRRMNGQMQ